MVEPCAHLAEPSDAVPDARVCPRCAERGDDWVHLGMCLGCGAVGCCDSSPNRHATAHFTETGHPTIRSVEPGERWRWCYLDEVIG